MASEASAKKRTETVFRGKNLEVVSIPLFVDNFLFAIRQPTENSFVMVDPGEAAPAIEFLERQKSTLTAIICTHEHSDHIGGAEELALKYPGSKLIGAPSVRAYLPKLEGRFVANEDETIEIGGIHFRLCRWFGHTADHLSYLVEEEQFLFCGDTVFGLGCGRIISGTYEQLFESLQSVKALPSSTRIFCSHEYSLRNLSFLRDRHTSFPESFLKREIPSPEKFDLIQTELEVRLKEESTTVPLKLTFELNYNPFLRAVNFAEFESIRKLRNQY